VGDNKSIKAVFSSHFWECSCCLPVKKGQAAATEKHKLAKSDLRELRESLVIYLLDDCSEWIENLMVPPR
jgi:hypothetical protein